MAKVKARWFSSRVGACAWLPAVCALALPPSASADASGVALGAYPLDALERVLPVRAPLPCDVPLVTYRGDHLRYAAAARVHPAFVEHLRALDAIVTQLALEHYGRAPRTLVHLGTHACRRMRRYPEWVSEHALGNAIDVAGFDFAALPRAAAAPHDLPRALRGAFRVRIDRHWAAHDPVGQAHSAFLRELARALIARPDVFRVVLGPAFPGHKNHFHLDFAPYRVVEVFEAGETR